MAFWNDLANAVSTAREKVGEVYEDITAAVKAAPSNFIDAVKTDIKLVQNFNSSLEKKRLEKETKKILEEGLNEKEVKFLSDLGYGNLAKEVQQGNVTSANLLASKRLEAKKNFTDIMLGVLDPVGKGKQVAKTVTFLKNEKKGIDLTKNAVKVVKNGKKYQVGNIRLDKFDLPIEAQDELAEVITKNKGFIDQRRGVQGVEKTQRLADEIVSNIKVKKGTALNAEQLKSLGDTVGGLQKQVTDLSKLVANPETATDLNKLLLAQAREELSLATASFAGALTEAGRSLNILKEIRKAIATQDETLVRKALDFTGEEDLKKFSDLILSFGDDEVAKYRFVRSLQKPKAKDFMQWYWYNNILSGPLTQIRNLVGNVSNTAFDITSKPFAATIDALKTGGAKVVGKERARQVTFSEIPSDIAGAWAGFKQGGRKGLFLLKNGFTMDDVVKSEFRTPEPFKGFVPNAINRTMGAVDTMFRSINTQREIYARTFNKLKKQGLKGEVFEKAFRKEILDPDINTIKAAQEAGARSVFQEEGGELTKWLLAGRKKVPALRLVIPFVQTPANIIKQGIELTPAGLVRGAGKTEARAFSLQQGRALLGSTLLFPLVMAAAEGNISGQGPSNKTERDALYREGWQPNSIKIGDKWYSYRGLGPFATVVGAVGNAHDATVYDGEELDAKAVGVIVAKSLGSILDESYLTGLDNLLNAIEDPERYGKSYINNQLRTLVPGSSFFGQVTRAIDRTVRRPETLMESIKAIIPGQSQELTPLRDVLGEPINRPGGFWNEFNPFRSSPIEASKMEKELSDAGITLGKPSKKIGTRDLNERQYSDLLLISGEIKKTLLSKLTETEAWANASQTQKEKIVRKITDTANDKAREVLRVEVELETFEIPIPEDDNLMKVLNEIIKIKPYSDLKDETKKKLIQKLFEKYEKGEVRF